MLQIVATYLTGGLVFYYFRVTIAPIVVLCAGGLVLAAECFVRLRVSDYNTAREEEPLIIHIRPSRNDLKATRDFLSYTILLKLYYYS